MYNSILEKYARVLVNYSLEIKKGDSFVMHGNMLTEPLIKAVYKEAILAGAHPIVLSNFQGQESMFYTYASEEQLKYKSPFIKYLYNNMDARLSILGNYNTKSLTNIEPEKMKKKNLANRDLSEIFMTRAARGDLRWNICQFPTLADAQEASMSLEEYENFVFKACHLDEEEPVLFWQNFGNKLEEIAKYLNKVDEIHFISKDTDVKCKVTNRTWVADKGKENYPGGEVFTGPIEDSVNGYIRFSFPGIYQGKEIEDIRLSFENGKVVKATAVKGEKLLHALLDTDEGARYVGEVAIGCNKGISTFSKNMLFDEKMGGTIHFAIGRSYPETGGSNISSIHWDMLCDMKNGGVIYTDGKKIYENGQFLI